MSFTAKDVKALRDATGAGMMDAKKALEAAGGDIEAAIDAQRSEAGLGSMYVAASFAASPSLASGTPKGMTCHSSE